MFRTGKGFSIVEVLIALAIAAFGVMLSVLIINNIGRFSAKQRSVDIVMSLESYLNEALLNSANYKPQATALNTGHVPTTLDFFVKTDAQLQLKIAQIDAANPARLYFDVNRNPCAKGSSGDCIYYTELAWASTTAPYKINFSVSVDDPRNQIRLAKNEQGLLVPADLYSDTSQLKCPQDGEKYLGIKKYDSVTGVVECWRFDKSVKCPADYYPVGLKLKDAASNDLVLDCKAIDEYKCPEGFAPFKAYPFDKVSLSDACISILQPSISLRIGHIIENIRASQPPNLKNYYGLKWVTGKLCPSGYQLKPKSSSAAIASDLRGVFLIQNSETKTECLTDAVVCGQAQDNIYCDACPYSDPTRKEGCEYRQFPRPPEQSVSSACRDPKIFDVRSLGLDNFTKNYDCQLNASLMYADGIASGGASSEQ